MVDMAQKQGQGVVTVLMNYRLNALGFLTGAHGIADQQLAMKWVRKYISHFGGNPAKVTLGGESFGGHAVRAHMVLPDSRGLFDQVFIASGAARTAQYMTDGDLFQGGNWINDYVGKLRWGWLLNVTGCYDITCVRKLPYRTIFNQLMGADAKWKGNWGMYTDGTVYQALDGIWDDYILKNDYAKVPVMIGSTSDEAACINFDRLMGGPGAAVSTVDDLTKYAKKYFNWPDDKWAEILRNYDPSVYSRYPNNTGMPTARLMGARIFSEGDSGTFRGDGFGGVVSLGHCAARRYARMLAERNPEEAPVYLYNWGQPSPSGVAQILEGQLQTSYYGPTISGGCDITGVAGHAIDPQFFWGMTDIAGDNGLWDPVRMTDVEQQQSRNVVKRLTNFMASSDPNGAQEPLRWEAVDASKSSHASTLFYNAQGNTELHSNFLQTQCDMWDKWALGKGEDGIGLGARPYPPV
jgi:carboxylesterase type B